jgi:Cu(I)/Ag(I) efflux system membrane fusion protein
MNKGTIVVIASVLALGVGMVLESQFQWLAEGEGKGKAVATTGEKEVMYWVAPMDPNFRRDKPGKSPMGMDLVPVYSGGGDDGDGVLISAAVENNLGVRTALVESGPLWRRIEATGYVGFDETRVSHIHMRTQGWIERLLVDDEGVRVEKGDLLFELYSPDIVNAQKEYLQAMRRKDDGLVRAADEKLTALGVSGSDVRELASRGSPSETIRVTAPQAGVVHELNVREGMHVMPSTVIMSLADLSSVWLNAEVYESQADWVANQQPAEARLSYLPGEVFEGRVDYVYPVLDPMARTLRVRLRFDNPDERLKPNMYARVTIFGGARKNLLSIPQEALIRSGRADRVVIALGEGRFQVQEVEIGMESGDWVEIRRGLDAGDRIVTSAQFLLDSEASINGSIRRLGDSGMPGQDHD